MLPNFGYGRKDILSFTCGYQVHQGATYTWRKYPSRIFEMNLSIIYEKNVYCKNIVFLSTSGQTKMNIPDITE